MENDLKILYIKQAHDSTGPFQSYGWDDSITALDMLKQFYGKTYQFETLLYYKCDFVIIPTKQNSPWLQTKLSINGYKEHIEQNVTVVIDPTKIDYGKYDVVITHDPILHPYIEELKKIYKDTLFTFIMAEHTSWQMHQFGFEYDLWLDHTLNSVWDVSRLPQSVNYIFPRTPELVQSMFKAEKESIFIDYRSYGYFKSKDSRNVALTFDYINEFNKNLKFDNLEIPIEIISETSLKPYMFTTNSDDSEVYYQKLSRAKYFVTIANRVGQAACDSASMGCLVIGNNKSKLHNLICHPDCLMGGDFKIKDVIDLITKIESDSDYYDMLILNQNKNLQKYGVGYDMDMLKKAVKLKRSK